MKTFKTLLLGLCIVMFVIIKRVNLYESRE